MLAIGKNFIDYILNRGIFKHGQIIKNHVGLEF